MTIQVADSCRLNYLSMITEKQAVGMYSLATLILIKGLSQDCGLEQETSRR